LPEVPPLPGIALASKKKKEHHGLVAAADNVSDEDNIVSGQAAGHSTDNSDDCTRYYSF
jgi:hypothetical protein